MDKYSEMLADFPFDLLHIAQSLSARLGRHAHETMRQVAIRNERN